MALTAAFAEGAEPSSYRTGNTASDVVASSRAGLAEERQPPDLQAALGECQHNLAANAPGSPCDQRYP
jgi:hypothetical protein